MITERVRVRITVPVSIYQKCVFLALQAGCKDVPEIREWLRSVGWREAALWADSILCALHDLKKAGLR